MSNPEREGEIMEAEPPVDLDELSKLVVGGSEVIRYDTSTEQIPRSRGSLVAMVLNVDPGPPLDEPRVYRFAFVSEWATAFAQDLARTAEDAVQRNLMTGSALAELFRDPSQRVRSYKGEITESPVDLGDLLAVVGFDMSCLNIPKPLAGSKTNSFVYVVLYSVSRTRLRLYSDPPPLDEAGVHRFVFPTTRRDSLKTWPGRQKSHTTESDDRGRHGVRLSVPNAPDDRRPSG